MTAPTVPGSYSYGLTCTNSTGQQVTRFVTITVTSANATVADCATTDRLASIVGTSAMTTVTSSALCLLCDITSPGNVVDADISNFATATTTLGALAATVTLGVEDTARSYQAGRIAAFKIAAPSGLLSAGVLQNLSLSTVLDGTVQETSSLANTLSLDLLNQSINGALPAVVKFTTTKDFDQVRLTYGATVAAANNLQIYSACVSLPP